MRVPFLDVQRALEAIRPELDDALASVLDRGQLILGPSVSAFEAELAAYCGAEHAVGVGSGTDALELALRAAGVGLGDEVIAPANTCVPTIAAIESTGALPVLVDVEPRTMTLDPEAVESAITEATRAIVPVHLYGQCADMGALGDLANAHDLIVIEDAAQAHGAAYGGVRTGALGDAAAFSFYPTKNLGALGDAGAVVTNSAEIADRVRSLRAYGEASRYESVAHGRNSRLDELHAEVLRRGLRRLEEGNARRRELAERYLERLEGCAIGLHPPAPGRHHVYHLFVVTTPDRDVFRARLSAAGVETLVHYPRAVHQHPAYVALGDGRALPTSELLASSVVSLPLSPLLTDDEQDIVIGAVRAAAG